MDGICDPEGVSVIRGLVSHWSMYPLDITDRIHGSWVIVGQLLEKSEDGRPLEWRKSEVEIVNLSPSPWMFPIRFLAKYGVCGFTKSMFHIGASVSTKGRGGASPSVVGDWS